MSYLRVLSLISLASALMAVLLMGLRGYSAISFLEPLQIVTTGYEQGNLFGIWKVSNGLDVYADWHALPYAVSYYNWGFYYGFGAFVSGVQSAFKLGDLWVPTLAHLFNLLGLCIGTVFCYASFRTITRIDDPAFKLICLSVAIFVFFGPLIGFYGLSARPDSWALVFEAIATYLFWHHYPERKVKAVIYCAVAAYFAWSFKHINVFTPIAVGMTLLIARDWKSLILFCGLLFGAYGGTFIIGGEMYIKSLFQTTITGFGIAHGVKVFSDFIVKSGPALAIFFAILVITIKKPQLLGRYFSNTEFRYAFMGLTASLLIVIPAAFKLLSADNYYFPVSYFLALTAVSGTGLALQELRSNIKSNTQRIQIFTSISAVGWILNIVAVLVVLTGIKGKVSIREQHAFYQEKAQCVSQLPKPVFSSMQFLSSPWLNSSRPIVFPAYNYIVERDGGEQFVDGGIDGMIQRGQFRALLLDAENDPFASRKLDRYERQNQLCGGMAVYLLKSKF